MIIEDPRLAKAAVEFFLVRAAAVVHGPLPDSTRLGLLPLEHPPSEPTHPMSYRRTP
ncbi:hypothetical protein [Kitasatospora sp. NPDC004272]